MCIGIGISEKDLHDMRRTLRAKPSNRVYKVRNKWVKLFFRSTLMDLCPLFNYNSPMIAIFCQIQVPSTMVGFVCSPNLTLILLSKEKVLAHFFFC